MQVIDGNDTSSRDKGNVVNSLCYHKNLIKSGSILSQEMTISGLAQV